MLPFSPFFLSVPASSPLAASPPARPTKLKLSTCVLVLSHLIVFPRLSFFNLHILIVFFSFRKKPYRYHAFEIREQVYSKHQKDDGTFSILVILILFICRYIDYQVKQLHNENYLAVSDGFHMSCSLVNTINKYALVIKHKRLIRHVRCINTVQVP